MNTPVNFEIAKLLNKKRLFIPSKNRYNRKGSFNYSKSWSISAPTIAEVVMWLYEKHGVWITACIVADSYFSYWLHNKNRALQDTKSNWLTPTEAYEAAIEYCLTNLIK